MPANIAFDARRYLLTLQRQSQRFSDEPLTISCLRSSGRDERLAAHVFAAAEQQCWLVGVGVALDVADEDDVVAAVMPILVAALEMRGDADQHRRAALRDNVIDLGEFV